MEYAQGAVYIEINKPVPVEELRKNDKEEQKDTVEESFDFEDFYKFVSENGLLIEEVYD